MLKTFAKYIKDSAVSCRYKLMYENTQYCQNTNFPNWTNLQIQHNFNWNYAWFNVSVYLQDDDKIDMEQPQKAKTGNNQFGSEAECMEDIFDAWKV